MNDRLKIALDSKSQFFIFEGNVENIINEVESFYKDKKSRISNIDGNTLNAENSRLFVTELGKKSGTLDVYIISNFEKIEMISQNILLKSLETVKENKVILAVCETTSNLLDTVLSRAYYVFIPDVVGLSTENNFDFMSENIGTTQKIKKFYELLDENNIIKNSYDITGVGNKENLGLKIRKNMLFLEYDKRINANCNKDLCADLLIYKMLEDR